MAEPIQNQAPNQFQGIKRSVAMIIGIKDILDGKYVKEEGWSPNYVITRFNKEVMRVNVIGAVVNKISADGPIILVLDDGSATIKCRTFESNVDLSYFDLGEIVQIIGKPREFGGERYILIEIIKKVNPLWGVVRKLEFEKFALENPLTVSRAESSVQPESVETIDFSGEEIVIAEPSQEIVDYISGHDKGDGVDIEEILLKVKIEHAEKVIRNLLEAGEIFEVKPGRVKVL